MRTDIDTGRIPDLDLWRTAQVNTGVGLRTLRVEHPVDIHLEVAILLNGTEVIVALAVEYQQAVLNLPVATHVLVGLLLCLRQLRRFHFRPGDRVLYQSLPAGQVLAVEDRDKAGLVGHLAQMGLDGVDLITGILTVQHTHDAVQEGLHVVARIVRVGHRDVGYGISGCRFHGLVARVEELARVKQTLERIGLLDLFQDVRLLLVGAGDLHRVTQVEQPVLAGTCRGGYQLHVAVQGLVEHLVGRVALADVEQLLGSLIAFPSQQGTQGGILGGAVAVVESGHDHLERLRLACRGQYHIIEVLLGRSSLDHPSADVLDLCCR